MHVFIVRPFGTKNGIDFDRVEQKLIRPAIDALGWTGGTTGEIVKQGNIREDMFEQLLIADLVIADITIHNANVFYELGIRHAFRDLRTLLINSEADDVPFDLKTDRYFPYDSEEPESRLDDLIKALKNTAASSDKDSPVFQLLPDLEPPDPSQYLLVPLGFREAVDQANSNGELQLLSAETDRFSWKSSGLRLIGRAQFKRKDWPGARATWNALRQIDPYDLEANIRLGTIYDRLGELQNSEHALARAAQNRDISISDRAELLALQARNAKTRWVQDWWEEENLDARQEAALISPHLERSFERYLEGFAQDRNHFYSGLNALAMATIMIELANTQPDIWEYSFDSLENATCRLAELVKLQNELGTSVKMAIDSTMTKLKRLGDTDPWAEISKADLALLILSNPERVGLAYKRAVTNAPNSVLESARNQILRYQALGILKENIAKALEVIPDVHASEKEEPPRVILFTGHRIDKEDREEPRFPADKEEMARKMIMEAISDIKNETEGSILGISGGASGGDILFHEVCEDLGIPTKMYIALPKKDYIQASVSDAGYDWIDRFNTIFSRADPEVLAETRELPNWLQEKREKEGYSNWQRANLRRLHEALAKSQDNVTLVALWNGAKGDGPGGTDDMIDRAKERKAIFVHLDARKLLD